METWFARSLILYISIHITKYPPCWRNRLPKPLRSSSGGAQVRINAQVLGTRWGYGGMDISWYFLGILLSNKNAERRFQWGINGIQWDSKTSWGFYNEKRLKPTILQRIWGIPVTKSGILSGSVMVGPRLGVPQNCKMMYSSNKERRHSTQNPGKSSR